MKKTYNNYNLHKLKITENKIYQANTNNDY